MIWDILRMKFNTGILIQMENFSNSSAYHSWLQKTIFVPHLSLNYFLKESIKKFCEVAPANCEAQVALELDEAFFELVPDMGEEELEFVRIIAMNIPMENLHKFGLLLEVSCEHRRMFEEVNTESEGFKVLATIVHTIFKKSSKFGERGVYLRKLASIKCVRGVAMKMLQHDDIVTLVQGFQLMSYLPPLASKKILKERTAWIESVKKVLERVHEVEIELKKEPFSYPTSMISSIVSLLALIDPKCLHFGDFARSRLKRSQEALSSLANDPEHFLKLGYHAQSKLFSHQSWVNYLGDCSPSTTLLTPQPTRKDIYHARHCTNSCELPGCKKQGFKMKLCSGCRLVAYCSRAHQSQDWKRHKVFCRDFQSVRNKYKQDF